MQTESSTTIRLQSDFMPNAFQLNANNMADNLLKRIREKFVNHVLDFAKQTALGGPKYFINRGIIKGHTNIKDGKELTFKMSRFDRLVFWSNFFDT